MDSSGVRDHNRRAWDSMAKNGRRFTEPAPDAQFQDPLKALDSLGWLSGNVRGQRVLCLAAGGGRQAPLFAAAGALVTVVDQSEQMLAIDRHVAHERGLELRTVQTSMDDLSPFAAGEFDLVIQPVSTCYVPQVAPVFRQVARIIRAGGLYISQHKEPASLQASVRPTAEGYVLAEPYYRQGPLPAVSGSLHREEGTLEFLHRWEELIGGLCRAGFVIEDLVEPCHADPGSNAGEFAHRSCFVAPYVRLKARRVRGDSTNGHAQPESGGAAALWLP